MIPNDVLAKRAAYFSFVCSVSLKNLRKLDKWKKKEEVLRLKGYLLCTAGEQLLKVLSVRNGKKNPTKT